MGAGFRNIVFGLFSGAKQKQRFHFAHVGWWLKTLMLKHCFWIVFRSQTKTVFLFCECRTTAPRVRTCDRTLFVHGTSYLLTTYLGTMVRTVFCMSMYLSSEYWVGPCFMQEWFSFPPPKIKYAGFAILHVDDCGSTPEYIIIWINTCIQPYFEYMWIQQINNT